MQDIYNPDFPENPEGPGYKVETKFGLGRTYDSVQPFRGKQCVYLNDGKKVMQSWVQMKLLEIIPVKLPFKSQE